MCRQINYYIFSILIVLIFISPSVYSITCNVSEHLCSSSSPSNNSWCCPSNKRCGSYYQLCDTPASLKDTATYAGGVGVFILVLFLCIFIRCLRYSICSQDCANTTTHDSNPQVGRGPYQQQPTSRPPRVTSVRPVYHVTVTPQIHNTYEASPPSYEAATTNCSPEYSSVSPTTSTATNEATILRV